MFANTSPIPFDMLPSVPVQNGKLQEQIEPVETLCFEGKLKVCTYSEEWNKFDSNERGKLFTENIVAFSWRKQKIE